MLNQPKILDNSGIARLEVRVSNEQKSLYQKPAALTGRTLSELVIDCTQAAAAKIVRENEIIRLSREEQVAFVSALLSPSKPVARLEKAVKNYRQKAGSTGTRQQLAQCRTKDG